MSPNELDRTLAGLDAVYVASGSTFALLEALQATGGGRVLSDHVRAGLPYIGASAGSIVAGPDVTPASLMDDPADGPALTSFHGLALVDQVVIPTLTGCCRRTLRNSSHARSRPTVPTMRFFPSATTRHSSPSRGADAWSIPNALRVASPEVNS